MTQMSASSMSWIWLVVLRIRPQKIDACCAISSAAKVDAEDDAEVLGPVAGQHLQGDPVHFALPFALRRPSAARLKSAMCSARTSGV